MCRKLELSSAANTSFQQIVEGCSLEEHVGDFFENIEESEKDVNFVINIGRIG